MKKEKKNNIFFWTLFFVLTFFLTENVFALTCSDVGGRCTESAQDSCDSDEYHFIDGDSDCFASNPMATAPSCCVEKACNGTYEECNTNKPIMAGWIYSEVMNNYSATDYCKASLNNSNAKCWERINNECTENNGTCVADGECTKIINAGSLQCASENPGYICCEKTGGSTENEECRGTCFGVDLNSPPAGWEHDTTGDKDCRVKNKSEYYFCYLGCKDKGYKCISSNATCDNNEISLNGSCGTGEKCCTDSGGTGGGGTNNTSGTGIDIPDIDLPDSTISEILVSLLDWILTIFLVLSLLAFAITGIQFLFSRSSSYGGGMEKAKKNFEYAILAVALVGASVVIVKAIDAILRVKTVI